MKMIIRRVLFILSFLRHANKHISQESYYPEEKRKSKIQIWMDYLIFVTRYGQIPRFYFVYGLDRSIATKDDYMPYSDFMRLRQNKNTVRIGSQTSYSYVCLLRDKQLFEWISDKYKIPTPKVLGVLRGG